MVDSPLPIAVLISGSGTTLRNLLMYRDRGELSVDIRVVISSRPQVRGLEIAAEAGVPTYVLQRRDFATRETFSAANFDICREAGVELVVMGGYLQHLRIPDDFENRVVNIHPSLIPAFCGEGFYGARVHQAALDYGVKVSGCTVHFVDNQYDNGPIILQRTVPVEESDTAASLAARVFAAECQAYPEAIQAIAESRLVVEGRCVKQIG